MRSTDGNVLEKKSGKKEKNYDTLKLLCFFSNRDNRRVVLEEAKSMEASRGGGYTVD